MGDLYVFDILCIYVWIERLSIIRKTPLPYIKWSLRVTDYIRKCISIVSYLVTGIPTRMSNSSITPLDTYKTIPYTLSRTSVFYQLPSN